MGNRSENSYFPGPGVRHPAGRLRRPDWTRQNDGVFDILIRNGWVFDGTGAPALRADIGITAGRIEALGRLDSAVAGTVIDAENRYVLPGFVDAHSHADAAVLDPTVALAALRQGVTTLVLGQDGLSFAPSSAA